MKLPVMAYNVNGEATAQKGGQEMYYCNKCGQEMLDSGHRCAVPKANASSQLYAVNPQSKTMSIEELRSQFEHEYTRRNFILKRDSHGQYMKTTTFQAWCAYKLCAKLNGLLPEGFDIHSKAAD